MSLKNISAKPPIYVLFSKYEDSFVFQAYLLSIGIVLYCRYIWRFSVIFTELSFGDSQGAWRHAAFQRDAEKDIIIFYPTINNSISLPSPLWSSPPPSLLKQRHVSWCLHWQRRLRLSMVRKLLSVIEWWFICVMIMIMYLWHPFLFDDAWSS